MSNATSMLISRFIYIGIFFTYVHSQNISADYVDDISGTIYIEDYVQGADAYRKGDYEAAAKKFLEVAEKGDPRSMYAIGSMYAGGTGIEQDYRKAYKWLNEAAKNNRLDAQYKVGLMHDMGIGVPQNYKKAALLYNKATQKGYPPAQFRLDLLYAKGDGVVQNNIQAYVWMVVAAQSYMYVIPEEEKEIAETEQSRKELTENELKIMELATIERSIMREFTNIHLGVMTELLKRIRAEITPEQLEEIKHLAIQYRNKYQIVKSREGRLTSENDYLFMPEIFHE